MEFPTMIPTRTTAAPAAAPASPQDDSQAALIYAALNMASTSNKDGAAHLYNGNMQKAYECFKGALEVVSGAELSLLLQPLQQQQYHHHNHHYQQQQYEPQHQQQQQSHLYQRHNVVQQQQQTEMPLYQRHYAEQHHQAKQQEQQQQHEYMFPSKELEQYAVLTQHTETLLRTNPPNFDEKNNNNNNNISPDNAMDTNNEEAATFFDKSAFFVYQKPFLFTPDPTTIITKDNISLYKAQIMFNLAITMHQGGRCVDESSVYKALNLYDLCLECSMKCGGGGGGNDNNNGSSSTSIDSLMLTIASLNNKAHVFHEFCEFSSLKIVLDTLFLAMAFLPRGIQPVEGKQIQGILFNVYMLRELNCARAA